MTMWRFGRTSKREATIDGPIIPPRSGVTGSGAVVVNEDSAMRHSAVWECLRIRADLVSTFPVDTFRDVNRVRVEVAKPPILVEPGGKWWPMHHWAYASQVDLDRCGNAIGLITEVNSLGLPRRIDLQDIRRCTVIERKGKPVKYRINGTEYDEDVVWHERQFPVAGMRAGLSPIAYAAWTISEGLSLQQFALQWFGNGVVPLAHLRNKNKELKPGQAQHIKEQFRASIQERDVWVSGNDWEYNFIQAESAGMEWLEGRKFGIADIARFFGVPADIINGAVSGQSVTYANITQRQLEFLILRLGPAVFRREQAWNTLLPRPRYVKLNTNAMLRMDPQTRAITIGQQIKDRVLTNTEARGLDDRAPLTQAEIDEFNTIYGAPRVQPTTATAGGV